ncbi:MAG: hypothetical protein GY744_16840 [Gammaproteobacteria bacterium]|nr:hypothetical protein [Gammaproteobacteria bacterium]
MFSKSILLKAVDHKILTANQVDPLFQFIVQQESRSPDGNQQEPLRFIRSFGDVFITIGIIMLVLAINMADLSGYAYFIPAAGFVLVSEWLVRVRKLALPGIAILIAILYFVNKAIDFNHQEATTFGLAILSLTSLIYYLRYKMPFSLLPLAMGLVAIVIIQLGWNIVEKPAILAIMGFIVFIVAMVFDVLDTRRVSHLSDSAFWLHLLASPLMVHGLMFSLLSSNDQWIQSIDAEIIIISFFIGFFLLALLVDRRAMLISTQLYMIYAVTQLLQNQINDTQNVLMLVLMALGLFVLFFGTYWYLARRFIFGFLSQTAINRFVPDLTLTDVKQ